MTTPPGTPQLGVSVATSPTSGVSVGVTLPPAIGPIPLLPGVPHSVQVSVGPGGVGVTSTPSGGTSTGGTSVAGTAPTAPGPASPTARRVGVTGPGTGAGNDRPRATVARWRTGQRPAGLCGFVPGREAIPGAVSASLRRPAPGGVWRLLRAVTSAHTLWIALAVRAARGALGDERFRARRPAPPASPAARQLGLNAGSVGGKHRPCDHRAVAQKLHRGHALGMVDNERDRTPRRRNGPEQCRSTATLEPDADRTGIGEPVDGRIAVAAERDAARDRR